MMASDAGSMYITMWYVRTLYKCIHPSIEAYGSGTLAQSELEQNIKLLSPQPVGRMSASIKFNACPSTVSELVSVRYLFHSNYIFFSIWRMNKLLCMPASYWSLPNTSRYRHKKNKEWWGCSALYGMRAGARWVTQISNTIMHNA